MKRGSKKLCESCIWGKPRTRRRVSVGQTWSTDNPGREPEAARVSCPLSRNLLELEKKIKHSKEDPWEKQEIKRIQGFRTRTIISWGRDSQRRDPDGEPHVLLKSRLLGSYQPHFPCLFL